MKGIKDVKGLISAKLISANNKELINKVLHKFSVSISSSITNKICNNDSNGLKSQFVPSIDELNITEEEISDPISDNRYSPIRGIVHRYPDRCLLTPIYTCPVYCRFCFRKEKIGREKGLSSEELESCYNYIEKNKNIWEVILTGGDPLILKPKKLREIISRISAIKHVEIIRIHTRVPVVSPEKINIEMLETLSLHKPTYIVLHANHTDEFYQESEVAISKIIDTGVPMLSQTVLLKGVNNTEEELGSLMRKFVKNRIKPYYLHHPDLVKGTKKFRVTIKKGQELMNFLRGRYSGLCQPTYVLDIPGGHGKSPISSSYIEQKKDNSYEVIDFKGNKHSYVEID